MDERGRIRAGLMEKFGSKIDEYAYQNSEGAIEFHQIKNAYMDGMIDLMLESRNAIPDFLKRTTGDDNPIKVRLAMDLNQLGQLKDHYNAAVASGYDTFTFQGQELQVDYAKYLIQYIENELEDN